MGEVIAELKEGSGKGEYLNTSINRVSQCYLLRILLKRGERAVLQCCQRTCGTKLVRTLARENGTLTNRSVRDTTSACLCLLLALFRGVGMSFFQLYPYNMRKLRPNGWIMMSMLRKSFR
jgi:hypothetical protein